MKRHAFRILLCLVLGVVTTVGVAWACARWSTADYVSEPADEEIMRRAGRSWVTRRPSGFPESAPNDSVVCFAERGFGLERVVQRDRYPGGWFGRLALDAGLPFPALSGCLWARWDVELDADGTRWCGRGVGPHITREDYSSDALLLTSGVPGDPGWDRKRPGLPLRAVWPGFLIDTGFYGGVWLALLFGFGTTRHVIRRRRGHCLACGYDLRAAAHTACPECGAPCRVG